MNYHTKVSRLVAIVAAACSPTLSLAHSGGLDANGCHAGSQPYHCHRSASQSSNSSSDCHPSYRGACVPIASDVDCAGGSGNGPAYVRGPVQVVGRDVYGLDRDGDGIACE
ncbi:YHYH domain-containing protein [Roseovarius sp.]|uniref:YHYH domain-containing protein n=1 Tax=Roseovarius sp. TaxID=1486281 RepID=UPI0034556D48